MVVLGRDGACARARGRSHVHGRASASASDMHLVPGTALSVLCRVRRSAPALSAAMTERVDRVRYTA